MITLERVAQLFAGELVNSGVSGVASTEEDELFSVAGIDVAYCEHHLLLDETNFVSLILKKKAEALARFIGKRLLAKPLTLPDYAAKGGALARVDDVGVRVFTSAPNVISFDVCYYERESA